jgi:AsmA protein
MQKEWALPAAAVVLLMIFVVTLVPVFVNADTFRPTVETQLSSSFGREVTMGRLTLSILAGNLVADDIAIADDPSFSSVPFIQAKRLDVGVEILPLVLHHQVHITRLNIDTPSIQLIQNATGKWNFSTIGGASGQTQSSSVPDLTVAELKITDGSATVSSIPLTQKAFQYSAVNLTVKSFSFLKSFPFDLSATLPGAGSLKLTGDAGPVSQKDTTLTPFQATLQLRDFDPVASGIIDQSKGISMVDDVDAQMKSDGVTVSSSGKIKAVRLQLVPRGSPAQEPVEMNYTVSDNLQSRLATVSDLSVQAGTAAVHVQGTFQFTAQAVMLDLHLTAPAVPVDQLENMLPVVGIHLPSGSSLQGGTLTANIAVHGPATTATLSGPVEIDNTRLVGFDLGSKIQGLNALSGTSAGTEIQVLKANVVSSPEGAKITDIYGNLPQLGSATGAGTVAQSGAIDFNLTAKLNSSNVLGAAANSAVNAVGGIIGGFLHPNSKPAPASNRGIPIIITGTASSPSIRANIGAMLR